MVDERVDVNNGWYTASMILKNIKYNPNHIQGNLEVNIYFQNNQYVLQRFSQKKKNDGNKTDSVKFECTMTK